MAKRKLKMQTICVPCGIRVFSPSWHRFDHFFNHLFWSLWVTDQICKESAGLESNCGQSDEQHVSWLQTDVFYEPLWDQNNIYIAPSDVVWDTGAWLFISSTRLETTIGGWNNTSRGVSLEGVSLWQHWLLFHISFIIETFWPFNPQSLFSPSLACNDQILWARWSFC